MKKLILSVIGISLLAFSVNCGGSKVSAEECETTLNSLMDKIATEASPEDKSKFEPMKATLMGKLKKDCMDGKFDTQCLQNASNLPALQTCLR